MSDSFYARLATTAGTLLAKRGVSALLSRPAPGAYSAETGTVVRDSSAAWRLDCILMEYDQRFVDGSLIRQGDRRAYAGASGGPATAPKPGDTITLGGEQLVVVSVKPLAPALVAVLWELQLRGTA